MCAEGAQQYFALYNKLKQAVTKHRNGDESTKLLLAFEVASQVIHGSKEGKGDFRHNPEAPGPPPVTHVPSDAESTSSSRREEGEL